MSHECRCNHEDPQELDTELLECHGEQVKFEELLGEGDLGSGETSQVYDIQKMKRSVELFLDAIGHPNWRNDPNTFESPERVSRMWETLLGGYSLNTDQYAKTFPATSDNAVFVSNLPFYSLCMHHFLPFHGIINLAYIPDGKVVGLSKLPRIARAHCKRLQLQEDLTKQIADDIERILKPKGVAVQIKASHECMSFRGVRAHGAITTTTHLSGLFKTDPAARNEFLETVKADPNVFKY